MIMLARDVTSLQHPIVKHLVKIREDRRYRSENKTALISGIKLIDELAERYVFKTLLVEKGYTPSSHIKAEQTFIVPDQLLKKVTGVNSPEPIAAEISLPAPSDLKGKKPLLILDGISDPGNLGNLLRTALALGWEGAFLTPRTADPFNDKALRAAKGATFKLSLKEGSYEELFRLLEDNQLELLIADAKGENFESMQLKKSIALALGNESHGVHAELKQKGRSIAISMRSEMESLNVSSAGAILMYQLNGECHVKR